MGLNVKKMTLRVQMLIVERRHMKAMKKARMTMTIMAQEAKRQGLKLFSIGKEMMTKGQVMKTINRLVKKKLVKGTHLTKKGMILTMMKRPMKMPKAVTLQTMLTVI